jgi:hypothetical protein
MIGPHSTGTEIAMKRVSWILVSSFCLAAAVYASIFPIAEIFTEVVILRTYDSQGSPHETRVTVIDWAGEPWVRGRPYRGWFRRIEANPEAELHRDDVWRPVLGRISRDAADAEAFDRVMLDTYGRAYRYVDFIARLSANEIPVRLSPRSP